MMSDKSTEKLIKISLRLQEDVSVSLQKAQEGLDRLKASMDALGGNDGKQEIQETVSLPRTTT